MSVQEPRRAVQAVAIAAVGVPAALLAHLLATGTPASAAAAALTTCAVLLVGGSVPARGSAALAGLTALTQLAAQSVLAALAPVTPGAAPPCIPAVGRAASLGVHLAVVRTQSGCPAGSLAVGTATTAALSALLVALVILAGNAALAVITGLLLGRAAAAGEVVVAVSGVLQRVLARTAALLSGLLPAARIPAPSPCPPPTGAPRPRVTAQCWPGVPAHRGPPAVPLLTP